MPATQVPQNKVQKLLLDLADASAPERPADSENVRQFKRVARTIPALLLPYALGNPAIEKTTFALTRNLSRQGAAFILQEPIQDDSYVVGFWHAGKCHFLLGEVRYREPIALGFWQIGIELTQSISTRKFRSLEKLSELSRRLVHAEDGN